MKPELSLHCSRTSWKGRTGYTLGNKLVQLTILMGGGHIAEFRWNDQSRMSCVSPLWVPPWPTIEPYIYKERIHSRTYGGATEGKLLSGLAGHSLCLDYFGLPSKEEVRQGLSLHGEAPSAKWRKTSISVLSDNVRLSVQAQLPAAGLSFDRSIELRESESVAYFEEIVENHKKMDHFFHWAEHVTLGLPFLSPKEATVTLPAVEAMTFPHSYDEGKALLASGKSFEWPQAPLVEGGVVDLSRPFLREGFGFVAAALVERNRTLGYIAAVNDRLRLAIVYVFRREDFPWVTVWEENHTISAVPWKRRTCARGLEFSTTPFPMDRREAFGVGKLCGESTLTWVPALGRKTVRYSAFLAQLPSDFGCVKDVRAERNQFIVFGSKSAIPIVIPASGIQDPVN